MFSKLIPRFPFYFVPLAVFLSRPPAIQSKGFSNFERSFTAAIIFGIFALIVFVISGVVLFYMIRHIRRRIDTVALAYSNIGSPRTVDGSPSLFFRERTSSGQTVIGQPNQVDPQTFDDFVPHADPDSGNRPSLLINPQALDGLVPAVEPNSGYHSPPPTYNEALSDNPFQPQFRSSNPV